MSPGIPDIPDRALPARRAPGSGSASPGLTLETVADFSGGKGRAQGLPGPCSRPGTPSWLGCSGPSRAGRNGSGGHVRREVWVRAARTVELPRRPRLQLRCERPRPFWPGTPGGTPCNRPRVPVLEVAPSACGPPRALAWYIPHRWRGWDPLALVSALGGVKALAERRPRATQRSGGGDAPPWKDAVLPHAVCGADCWPPSGTIFAITLATPEGAVLQRGGHRPLDRPGREALCLLPAVTGTSGSTPIGLCSLTGRTPHRRGNRGTALRKAVSHASRGFVAQSSLAPRRRELSAPWAPGQGLTQCAHCDVAAAARGWWGGARAHPGHASPWLWGASEIPRAHSLHPAGFRSAERPRSLPREGRACLGCLTPLARAVPAGCRCSGRALTGTHVPHGPHGGAALVPDGAQVRMLPLSIPSRVTWGKTLQVSVPRFPHV